tara:strand:+ start:465 stop:848 length:384 start_codon:yes stop_codon:yes gene_type:complete
MSTRATYKFVSDWAGTHTAYIHHDGYPIGAAGYLNNQGRAISSINTFIRANEQAEITADHDSHADTDYRYTIDGTYITAEERVKEDAFGHTWQTDKFKTFWEGDIEDFLIIFCPHADDLKFINEENN